MDTYTYLENYVNNYVQKKLGEGVRVVMVKNNISVESDNPKGSVILGIFWMKVLQHELNYSQKMYKYDYRSDLKSSVQRVSLRVEDVELLVDLNSGTLTIKGEFAKLFFRTKMLTLLNHYDGLTECEDGEFHAPKQKHAPLRSEAERTFSEELKAFSKPYSLDVWTDDQLKMKCSMLTNTCLIEYECAWKLWRSLLNKWWDCDHLHQPQYSATYIAAIDIDSDALRDICELADAHKHGVNLDAFYVNMYQSRDALDSTSAKPVSFPDVHHEALKKMRASEHRHADAMLEHRVFSRVRVTQHRLCTTFFAAVRERDSTVELLVISGQLHTKLLAEDAVVSAQFIECSLKLFRHDYLNQIKSQLLD